MVFCGTPLISQKASFFCAPLGNFQVYSLPACMVMVYLPAFSCFFYDKCKKKYHTQILWVSQLPIAPQSKTYPEFCGPKRVLEKKTRKTRRFFACSVARWPGRRRSGKGKRRFSNDARALKSHGMGHGGMLLWGLGGLRLGKETKTRLLPFFVVFFGGGRRPFKLKWLGRLNMGIVWASWFW